MNFNENSIIIFVNDVFINRVESEYCSEVSFFLDIEMNKKED
jgi:hypothetical protein